MSTLASHQSDAEAMLSSPLAPACPDSRIPAGSIPVPGPAAEPALSSLSIVLPCFNEEANVADAIRNAAAAAALTSEKYEIIVVDDGSTDNTAAVAARFAGDRVRLVVHARNRGYGEAVRSGIAAAQMAWVLLTDADLQFDLRELDDFVPLATSADVLWGRRILRQDPIRRRAAAAAWNGLVRRLFALPLRDVDCGFKLIRSDLLARLELRAAGAMISTELAVKCRAAGAHVAEVGVHHRARSAGEATGGDPRVVLRALRELVMLGPALRGLSRARVPLAFEHGQRIA
jgi:Glycosyl transferase family 2